MRITLPRIHHAAFLLLALAGLALTIVGLRKIGLPPQVGSLRLWIVVLGLLAALVFGARLRTANAAALLMAAFATATGQVWPVLVVAWCVAAFAIVGAAVLRLIGAADARGQWLSCVLVGAGIVGTIIGLLAHYRVNYPGVYAFVLALPLLAGWRQLVRWAHGAGDWFKGGGVRPGAAQLWLEMGIATIAFIHFAVAFLPELGYDALAMHLFVAEALRTRHEWAFDVDKYVWAVLPLLVDWTYAVANMLGGETAARLLNVGFVFAVAWLVRDLVRWAGGSLAGQRWAVLVFLVTPLTFTESHALFIEGGWTAFLVAGFLAVLRVLDGSTPSRSGLPLAGLLCGFALASKAVTLPFLPVLLLVMVARPSTWLKGPDWPHLAKAVALGALVGCVPYVTAWVIAANPVFPFFNGLFKSPFYPPVNFEPPPFERHLSWNTIYRVTFESAAYLESLPGAAGFQWLPLLAPCTAAALLAREHRWRAVALLVLGVLGIAAVFQQTAYLRYVFPSLAILSALIGTGLGVLVQTWAAVPWSLAGLAVVMLNASYFHAGAIYGDLPLKAALSQSHRRDLVANRQALRGAVPLLNELNELQTPVVWVADSMATGLVADALYPQWYNLRFMNEFAAARTEQQMIALLGRREAEFALIDSNWQYAHHTPVPIEQLLKVTEEVSRSGNISLRRTKRELLYSRELARSPDFAEPGAWNPVPGARVDTAARSAVVTPQAGVFQGIPVTPGKRYLNTTSVRCDTPQTQGRLQINWVDASGKLLSVSAKAYRCSGEWSSHTQEVRAPRHAANAVLYSWGQVGGPVTVNLNSLKGSP